MRSAANASGRAPRTFARRLVGWLACPGTAGLDPDDPRTTELRRHVIRTKGLLQHIYREWYDKLAGKLPEGEGRVLELGTGAGFFAERIPRLITS